MVYEQDRALAERYGTYIVDSEIVGLTPAKAMIDCAEFYLKARDFNCHNQIMEYHLLDMKEKRDYKEREEYYHEISGYAGNSIL